ncbi:VWA domain-containing protein [Microbacterium sp. NPDC091382]|uniref:VWA domain-containing protein n=1 Tax=Microbacterium sp. NPDC091382 TaxID=3364210 RepID=UPI003808B9A4
MSAAATVSPEGGTLQAWQSALELWGVHLRDVRLAPGEGAAKGTAAWFSFPPSVTVDPEVIRAWGVEDEVESLFAHEIGHHVLAPATRTDALKIRHQLARALAAAGADPVGGEDLALLSNLWTDLLVNARVALLQHRRGDTAPVGIVRLVQATLPAPGSADRLWWVYLRTFELVWGLPAGRLCPPAPPAPTPRAAPGARNEPPLDSIPEKHREKERALREARRERDRIAAELSGAITTQPAADADQLARVVRSFAHDPVLGALRFGVLTAPYIVERQRSAKPGPTSEQGAGCAADDAPATSEELGRILSDRRLHGGIPDHPGNTPGGLTLDRDGDGIGQGKGQALGLARTLELYGASDPDEVMAAWYRAEAAPWVRSLTQRMPAVPAPELPGPLEVWEAGDDLADLDWSATLQAGATVLPGVTTRRRSFLPDEPAPREASIALDVFIDSSGSMSRPDRGSPAVLAGMIVALSVLRGGGRVRVTSFSGPGQVAGSEDFQRTVSGVVRDLACYFGGGTTFPLDLLERRYAGLRPPGPDERRHLLVLSDDGLVSMFGDGNAGHADVAERVRPLLTTATLLLTVRSSRVDAQAEAAGYEVLHVRTMDDAPAACARLAEALHG